MEFNDAIKQFAKQIGNRVKAIETEEATKTSLIILPTSGKRSQCQREWRKSFMIISSPATPAATLL